MSDSTAIEALAWGFYLADDAYRDTWESQPEEGVKDWYRRMARAALAALRADGLEIYRPDECPFIVIDDGIGMERGPWRMVVDWNVIETYLETDLPDGRYRLVPVGGED